MGPDQGLGPVSWKVSGGGSDGSVLTGSGSEVSRPSEEGRVVKGAVAPDPMQGASCASASTIALGGPPIDG